MRLKQSDIAEALGTTRAYVSAVERGVGWDPDADKLVLWARTLAWEDDHILRRLGRTTVPMDESQKGYLSDEAVEMITRVLTSSLKEGFDQLADRIEQTILQRDAPQGDPPARRRSRAALP